MEKQPLAPGHARVRGYAQALRWAGLKELLFHTALRYGADVTILHESTGLLRTTIFYQFEGEEQAVRKCCEHLRIVVNAYNKA